MHGEEGVTQLTAIIIMATTTDDHARAAARPAQARLLWDLLITCAIHFATEGETGAKAAGEATGRPLDTAMGPVRSPVAVGALVLAQQPARRLQIAS